MGETVEFASNGGTASGYLAAPAGGSGPGVLVLQEWWGLNPQLKGVADRLAGEGFVALAPDLYHGELAEHDEMDKAAHLMTSLPADRAGRDMLGAIDYLLGRPGVSGAAVGVVGFCMGGLLTLVVSAMAGGKVKGAVPFYGFPQGDTEPDWSGLTATVRGHMAESDDFFSPAAAGALEQKLKGMGKDVSFTIHPAGHAFMNETNALGTHDPDLTAQCWSEMTSFLHAQLG